MAGKGLKPNTLLPWSSSLFIEHEVTRGAATSPGRDAILSKLYSPTLSLSQCYCIFSHSAICHYSMILLIFMIILLFISRRLQTQLEAFKTAEAASGKQTKVFVVLFSLFEFFFISEGNLKREI